jgi:hypothetical protein
MAGDKITEHPILAKLTAGGADNAMSLSGYIGTSLQDGHVKLYPTLDDLSESVEIARADILHAADDPKAAQGGTTVWVKKDAPVTYHRTESVKTSAQQLPITFSPGGARAGAARAINDAVDVARGRLRMQVPPCGGGGHVPVALQRLSLALQRLPLALQQSAGMR